MHGMRCQPVFWATRAPSATVGKQRKCRSAIASYPRAAGKPCCLVARTTTNAAASSTSNAGEKAATPSRSSSMPPTMPPPAIAMFQAVTSIACLPDFMVRQAIEQGELVTVLDAHIEHQGTFRLLWPSSKHLAPKLRVFIDFMVEARFAEKNVA